MLAGGKHKGARGKITAVDSGSITVSNKKSGTTSTYKITRKTKISVDGQPDKSASDITVGMRASIRGKKDTARSIKVTTKKKGKKGKKTAA